MRCERTSKKGSTALKLASDKGRESAVNVFYAAGAIDQRPQPQSEDAPVDAVVRMPSMAFLEMSRRL